MYGTAMLKKLPTGGRVQESIIFSGKRDQGQLYIPVKGMNFQKV